MNKKSYSKKIKVEDIIVNKRLREIDENTVLELCNSIKKIGLQNNIVVNQKNELVSGCHRLTALKRLNHDFIECKVIETKSEDDKIILEVHENLFRKELGFIEKAHQLVLLKDKYEIVHPETAHGKNKKSSQSENIPSFYIFVANSIGIDKSKLSRLIRIGELAKDEEIRKDIKKLELNQADCLQLLKCNDKNKTLKELKNMDMSNKTKKEILYPNKQINSNYNSREIVKTPLITNPINNKDYKENQILKINMLDKIDIEYYYADKLEIGKRIIKMNDMLQYHYFAQDYNVIDTAQLICLITIKNNHLKEYIGFVSMNSPTLDKKFRNMFFGNRFLNNMYSMFKNLKFLNMSRRVMLPSYRGMGLTKKIQSKIVDDLFNNRLKDFTEVVYIESNSIMLHTFDFVDDSFNKTFMNLKNILSENDYKEFFRGDNNSQTKGYKEGTVQVANTAFKFNKLYFNTLQKYLKNIHNIVVEDRDKDKLLNDVSSIFLKENEEILDSYIKEKKPLMLFNIEEKSQLVA